MGGGGWWVQRADNLTPREFPVQWGNRHGTDSCQRRPLLPFLEVRREERERESSQI